jgi:hypothetical protein
MGYEEQQERHESDGLFTVLLSPPVKRTVAVAFGVVYLGTYGVGASHEDEWLPREQPEVGHSSPVGSTGGYLGSRAAAMMFAATTAAGTPTEAGLSEILAQYFGPKVSARG